MRCPAAAENQDPRETRSDVKRAKPHKDFSRPRGSPGWLAIGGQAANRFARYSLALLALLTSQTWSGGARGAYDYPIVERGPKALIGQPVRNLSAYARQANGTWHRIALQVDEVNAHGDYVLAGGIPYTAGTDDGILDANDEVVLLGEELGADFAAAAIPGWIKSDGASFWKFSAKSASAAIGYALIVSGKVVAPNAAARQVVFDERAGTIVTSAYKYTFAKPNPALLGAVVLPGGTPLIKSSQFLMPLRTPFFMPNITVLDTDFTSQIECWQSGPIRSIVAVGVNYTSFLSILKLHLFSELVFYRQKFEIPTKIEFIFDPQTLLKPGSGLFYSLHFPDGRGWVIDSNLAALPAAAPDDVVEEGPKAAGTPVFQAQGREAGIGSFLVRVRVDERAKANVPPPFLIRKADFTDPAKNSFWPWIARAPGDLGVFLDISQVRKGIYDFGLDLILSPKADETFKDYGTVNVDWQQLP